RGLGRVLTAHGGRALAPAARADMRLAFRFLLSGLAFGLLLLAARVVALLLLGAVIFRGARLMQRDGDRLFAAFDLAAFAAGPALQFAMLEFMHDAAFGLSLAW